MGGMSDSATKAPNCLACIHYKVSWDPSFPRSCTQFGIKSRAMPSLEVFRATGKQCPVFQKNPLYH